MARLFEDDFVPAGATSWKRPGRGEGLYDDENVVLFKHVDPNDVNQGGLGDCWILSSMAALAEFPGAITKLFQPQAWAEDGKYTIQLWSWAERRWKSFVIDDRFPTDFTGEACRYVKLSPSGEIWPCLLEKAFAKYSGGYDNINGGNPAFSLAALTGCEDIVQLVKDREDDSVWNYFKPKWTADLVKDGPDEGDPITDTPLQELDAAQLLRLIQDADQQNFVMTASKYNTIGRALGNMFCPICTMVCVSDTDRGGIAYGHAYSLITVLTNAAGTGYDLVCLRNPWGEERVVEWEGDWSDGDDMWRRYPQVKAAAQQKDEDDGLFWMEFGDFVDHYDTIAICRCSMGVSRVVSQLHPQRTAPATAKPKRKSGKSPRAKSPRQKPAGPGPGPGPPPHGYPPQHPPPAAGYPQPPAGYPQPPAGHPPQPGLPPPQPGYPTGYPPY